VVSVALFIAVVSQLKEATVSRRFVVDVPFNTAAGWPEALIDKHDPSAAERTDWYSAIAVIYGQSSADTIIGKPVPNEEMFAICAQVVQYKLLQDLRDSQFSNLASPPTVDGKPIPSFLWPVMPGSVRVFRERNWSARWTSRGSTIPGARCGGHRRRFGSPSRPR